MNGKELKTMRIMTKTQYDAVCDIVMEQKRRLEEKEAEITRLNNQIAFLESLIKNRVDVQIIDVNDKQVKECFSELRFGD